MKREFIGRGGGILGALVATTVSASAMVISPWTPVTTPKYYYGTYNPVHYSARPENGEKIIKLTLYIGGEATYVLNNASGTSRPAVAQAIFDSTHFPLGAGGGYNQLETHLVVEYKDSAGVVQPPLTGGSVTIPIKNKALIATLGFPPFDAHVSTLPGNPFLGDLIVTGSGAGTGEKGRLTANNIAVTTKGPFSPPNSGFADGWTFTGVKNDTSPNHIVIVNTHGHATLPTMADGNNQYTFDSDAWKTQVIASFGTDNITPLNANAVPPINMLFLVCCKQGSFVGPKWSDELFPYQNSFLPGQLNPNQACIGFGCAINAYGVPGMMDTILQDMITNSRTLEEAIDNFLPTATNIPTMAANDVGANGEPTGPIRKLIKQDFFIAGDKNMRIHGVYTGDTTQATNGWWR